MERSDTGIGEFTGDMAAETSDVRQFPPHVVEGGVPDEASVVHLMYEQPGRRLSAAERLRHVVTMGYNTPNRIADRRIS